MSARYAIFAGLAFAGLSACTQPEPMVIAPQPMSDKFGALYCPEGYVLQGDVCVGAAEPGMASVAVNPATPDTMAPVTTAPAPVPTPVPVPVPVPDPVPGQNQNQNTIQNTNQNTNQNG